jgi:hypothetical protein
VNKDRKEKVNLTTPRLHRTGGVAQSGRDVRQPNRVLANGIGGNKAERRPRAGKEWLAATKHDGVEVEPILINKTKVG